MSAKSHRVYLDTSVVMALVCPEPETDFVIGWFRSSVKDVLLYTPWLSTELSSALSIKLRNGQLKKTERPVAWHAAQRVLQTAQCETLMADDFDHAAELCAHADWKLRGPDALHLSAAKRLGCRKIASLDQVMCDAARKIGIEAVPFHGKQ